MPLFPTRRFVAEDAVVHGTVRHDGGIFCFFDMTFEAGFSGWWAVMNCAYGQSWGGVKKFIHNEYYDHYTYHRHEAKKINLPFDIFFSHF